MSENPYEAPEANTKAAAAPTEINSNSALLIVLSIAAAILGLSSYWMPDSYGFYGNDLSTKGFWATPVIALLLSAVLALRNTAAVSLQQALPKLVGITMMSLMVVAGGYICFATTCCCSNLVVVEMFPFGTKAERISFSTICVVAMVFSCVVTSTALRNFSKGKIAINEDEWV